MRQVAGIDCMPMSAGSINQAGVRRVQFTVAELASVRSRYAAAVSAMLDGLRHRRLTEHEAILRRSHNVNAIRFDRRSVCQRDDGIIVGVFDGVAPSFAEGKSIVAGQIEPVSAGIEA
jgi:hypothetical protein